MKTLIRLQNRPVEWSGRGLSEPSHFATRQSRHEKKIRMSHKTARLSEAELKAKEVRIRRTYESIQQGYIDLAVDLDDARARGDFRPGTFAEWVKDNFPFSVREAHRLATNHAVVTVTRQLFHQTPKTPYAARTLAPFADELAVYGLDWRVEVAVAAPS